MEFRPILSTLRRHKLTALLLILEIALTCAIVCNAVFLISQRLQRMDIPSGIAEHELVQIQLAYIGNRPDADARAETDLAALRQIPGVQQAALSISLPFSMAGPNSDVKLLPGQRQRTINVSNYFGQNLLPTLGLKLVAGRDFRPEEYVGLASATTALQNGLPKGLPQTIIISKAVAERLWPGRSALGETIYFGNDIPFRVIGVVAQLARSGSLYLGANYSMLMPVSINLTSGGSYVIRCAPQERAQVLKSAIAKLKQIDPRRVVLQARTFDELRSAYFASDRSMAGILAGVIVALLIVTALGIVGLASFWVAQRRRTIGVRRALGATRANILHYFQTENFLLATIGIALGMLLAYAINLFLMLHYELPRLPLYYLPIGALTLWLRGAAGGGDKIGLKSSSRSCIAKIGCSNQRSGCHVRLLP
jgi:putative ABC transport system permease protein